MLEGNGMKQKNKIHPKTPDAPTLDSILNQIRVLAYKYRVFVGLSG